MKYSIMIILLVAAVIIVGCTTKGTTNSGTQNAMQQTPGENSQNNAQNTNAANNAADNTANQPSATSDFMGFFSKGDSLQYMVAYDLVITATNLSTQTMSYTEYIKASPAGSKIRMDTNSSQGPMQSYISGTSYDICTQSSGAWTCFSQTYNATKMGGTDQKLKTDIKNNQANYAITSLPSMTVAGATAKCYEVTYNQTTVDYCFSPEGVPLYIKSSYAGALTEMKATKYSTSVMDSDFDLPAGATVQDLSKMYNYPTPTQ